MKQPKTPAEWQQAVTLAEAMLLFDSAKQYGLVEFSVTIDVERCVELLAQGKARGIVPLEADVESAVRQLVAELNKD